MGPVPVPNAPRSVVHTPSRGALIVSCGAVQRTRVCVRARFHRIATLFDPAEPSHGVHPYALDPAAALRLWQVSEQMVKHAFPVARL